MIFNYWLFYLEANPKPLSFASDEISLELQSRCAWLPDGFVQKDLTGYENSSEKVVYISFENEENHSFPNITISYLYAAVSNIYEKNNTKVTIYQKMGLIII